MIVRMLLSLRFRPSEICRLETTGRRKAILPAARAQPGVDARQQPVHLQIRKRAVVRQRPGELSLAVMELNETPDDFDARIA